MGRMNVSQPKNSNILKLDIRRNLLKIQLLLTFDVALLILKHVIFNFCSNFSNMSCSRNLRKKVVRKHHPVLKLQRIWTKQILVGGALLKIFFKYKKSQFYLSSNPCFQEQQIHSDIVSQNRQWRKTLLHCWDLKSRMVGFYFSLQIGPMVFNAMASNKSQQQCNVSRRDVCSRFFVWPTKPTMPIGSQPDGTRLDICVIDNSQSCFGHQ